MNIHEVTGGGVGAFVSAAFTLPLVSGVWCESSVLCRCGEVAAKKNHLKCLPMVSTHSQFWYPTSSGRNMVYYRVSTDMWILGLLYGEDIVSSTTPFTTFMVFALSLSADVRTLKHLLGCG